MSPPIQLIDYVPEEYHFEADPAYRLDPERAEEILDEEPSVSIDVDWSDPKVPPDADAEEGDHPDEAFIFNLTVLVNDEDDAGGTYRIRLRFPGMFQRAAPDQRLDDEDADNDYLAHTLSSCISMLYGAARRTRDDDEPNAVRKVSVAPHFSDASSAECAGDNSEEEEQGENSPPET